MNSTWFSPEGFLAVEPFASQAIEKVVIDGILQTRVKKGLVRLKLITAPLDKFPEFEGEVTHVYLPSDYNTSTIFGRDVYEIDGIRFILVPMKDIKMFTQEDD